MKQLLIGLGILLGLVFISLIVLFLAFHQPRPKVEANKEGDHLAHQMLDALQVNAWDSTNFIRWSSPDGHDYFWDKQEDLVEVRWKENQVLLHTKSLQGQVYQNGQLLDGKKTNRLKQKAWEMFCNDSFWLCAPYKVFDPGTKRAFLELDTQEKGLLITYSSGGVTPGDAYLWILGDDYIPKAFKMWVKILPIGGIEASWGDWKTTGTGAILALQRQVAQRVNIDIKNLQTGHDLEDFEMTKSPFEGFTLSDSQKSNL